MTFFKDKICVTVGLILCLGFLIYAFGCQPKTKSLLDPNRKVTGLELNAEVDFLIASYENRKLDLKQQQQIRDFILQQSFTIAQTGQVNPISIATSLMSLLGLGVVADDIRLRKERKKFMTYEPVKPDGHV